MNVVCGEMGNTKRGEHSEEINVADNMRLIKPCNISQWKCVLALHNREHVDKDQGMTSCRREFAAMHHNDPVLNTPDIIQDI
eukprot:5718827-Ditylum_brightwellii.AAC.1